MRGWCQAGRSTVVGLLLFLLFMFWMGHRGGLPAAIAAEPQPVSQPTRSSRSTAVMVRPRFESSPNTENARRAPSKNCSGHRF